MLLVRILACLFLSIHLQAAFTVAYSGSFLTDEDDANTFSYSKMNNSFFLGASFDSKNKLYFGQHIMMFNRGYTVAGDEVDISTLELGPMVHYYFTAVKTIFVSFSWNPYAKGERTTASVTSDVSGSSLIGTIGYHLRITKKFRLGASLKYHALSITKSVTENVETEVTESYTTIMPMIELTMHFR